MTAPVAVVLAAASDSGWTGHDTRLVLVALAGIALIVVLISVFDLHPFLR